MHTERQLAIVALEDALGGDTPLNINFENDDNVKTILFFVESVEK